MKHALEQLGFPLVDTVAPGAAAPASRSLGYFLDDGAAHSEAYWGARFPHPFGFLFPPEVLVAASTSPA